MQNSTGTARKPMTRPTKMALAAGASLMALLIAAPATAVADPSSDLADAQRLLRQCQLDLQYATTSGERTRAQQCITMKQKVITGLTAPTPTPTGTSTPTPGPTVTPTPSPTVAPTSPTATPPPTTTTAPGTNCMPVPSACGWPDETNTGTTGVLAVVPNSVTLSTPGQVYENRDVRGCITVLARNVTIRNVKVTCAAPYSISVRAGNPNVDNGWQADDAALVVEDSEINMTGQWEGKAIAFSGYTLRRVHVYGGADCAHGGVNIVVEYSFCDIPRGGPANGPHYDGIQSDGGRNITIRHNTIRVPYAQTAAILMSTNTSAIRDVSIVDNLVAGGGYSIYCGTDEGGPVLGSFTFRGNRVAKTYFAKGGYWGPLTSCPSGGAVWDETGLPIT